MKKLVVVLFSLISLSVMAKTKPDFSGCIAYTEEGQKRYDITANGTLARSKTKGNVDTYKSKDGSHTMTLERDPDTKLPFKLTSVYSGKTRVRTFRYDKKNRCLLNEEIVQKTSKTKKSAAVVTYDHELCEKVQDWYNQNRFQIDRCAKEFEEIGKELAEFDQKFKAKGKDLNGYSSAAFKSNPFATSLVVAHGCEKAREASNYPYLKRVLAFDSEALGIEFRGIPINDEPPENKNDAR